MLVLVVFWKAGNISEQQKQLLRPGVTISPQLKDGTHFYISFDGTGVPCAKTNWKDGEVNKKMVRLAPAKPNWVVFLLKWAWTRRAIRSGTPIRRPTSGPLNRALSLAGRDRT